MKANTALEKSIKKIIEENCSKNLYVENFSMEAQQGFMDNSGVIASIAMEDTELVEHIGDIIEESIRIMILRRED